VTGKLSQDFVIAYSAVGRVIAAAAAGVDVIFLAQLHRLLLLLLLFCPKLYTAQ